jgi:hypothetical protein
MLTLPLQQLQILKAPLGSEKGRQGLAVMVMVKVVIAAGQDLAYWGISTREKKVVLDGSTKVVLDGSTKANGQGMKDEIVMQCRPLLLLPPLLPPRHCCPVEVMVVLRDPLMTQSSAIPMEAQRAGVNLLAPLNIAQ